MPNRSSKTKRPPSDANQSAFAVLKAVTDESDEAPKNPAAVALGRLGGLRGGRARADALSSARRKAIARKAAESRWKKR